MRSVRQPWTVFAVEEEIIHRNRDRISAPLMQCKCQAARKGRFPCGAGSGNQNDFQFRTSGNLIRQRIQIPRYAVFIVLDQLRQTALADFLIELRNHRNSGFLSPAFKLAVDLEQLGLIDKLFFSAEPEALMHLPQRKLIDPRSVRKHHAVKIIVDPRAGINTAFRRCPLPQQTGFVRHPQRFKMSHSLRFGNDAPVNRFFLRNHVPHLRFNLFQLCQSHGFFADQRTIQAARQRMLDQHIHPIETQPHRGDE